VLKIRLICPDKILTCDIPCKHSKTPVKTCAPFSQRFSLQQVGKNKEFTWEIAVKTETNNRVDAHYVCMRVNTVCRNLFYLV